MPRPGSLRLRSGTMCPCGETTKRISSSIGRTSRLTAHIRTVADPSVRGPLSRSGSADASMCASSPCHFILLHIAHRDAKADRYACGTRALRRLVFGGLGLRRRLGKIGLGDPAGLDARLHDQGLGVLARNLVGIENARMFGRLAAFLAFGPADQVIGGAAREILDSLDVVLAEFHQHP